MPADPPADPFAHHPGLRDRLTATEASFFRTFTFDRLVAQHPHLEALRGWAHDDATRDRLRAEALAGHAGDLWVFAYGSLMWDPALRFTELRRARVADRQRRMILLDAKGGRGTPEAPGLMAALDRGAGCEGLVFRLAAETVPEETAILFRREMFGPGYLPRFVTAETAFGPVRALTFLADPASPDVRPDLTRAEQVALIATGAGVLGSSRDYLAGIVAQFEALRISDPDCVALLDAVDVHRAQLEERQT